ncbi:hypothetical protein Ddc_08366 [Ditylenchus destructor]|nr:hypothetical protein Ddc_08366 [Ditylenchus destructor]
MVPTPSSASSTTSEESPEKIRERLSNDLLFTVGPFGTVHGCTFEQAKRKFTKDCNKSLENYAQELGYYPSNDGLLFMLADLKDYVRLAHDSINDDLYDSIETEIRVCPVNRPEISHCFFLIDRTVSKDLRTFCQSCDEKGHTSGVVCAVEDHQCFVYNRDFTVEPVLVYANGGKRLALGQWIDFVAEEKEDGSFEIIEYRETNQPFHTLRCKSTVMVRCSVQVPDDVLLNPEQPMHSPISNRVFCEDMSIVDEFQGKKIQAVLRYNYDASDAYGYWNLECVVPE